jgi:hypothetical protein
MQYISQMRRGERYVDDNGATLLTPDGTPVRDDWAEYTSLPYHIPPWCYSTIKTGKWQYMLENRVLFGVHIWVNLSIFFGSENESSVNISLEMRLYPEYCTISVIA